MNPSEQSERRRFERRRHDREGGQALETAESIRKDYRRLGSVTTTILALLFVVQLGLGVWAVTISGRQSDVEANSRRIDAAVCAEVHYLERGEQLTSMDPKQSIVHNELVILLRHLRPLVPDCPPAKPLKLPGATEGAWENPPAPTPVP